MKLILFDIDGTLLLSKGAGMRAMERAGKSVFGDHFTFEGITPAGGLDPMLVAQAAANHGIDDAHDHQDRFLGHYREALEDELRINAHRLQVMPGIMPLLEELRSRQDLILGLLTGNFAVTAKVKLNAAQIPWDWFRLGAFGDDGPYREDLPPVAIQRCADTTGHQINPEHVIIIGDTPRDIDCARANGCISLAVATGPYDTDQLASHGPDILVADLADPSPLMDVINA